MTWDGQWREPSKLPPLRGEESFRGMSGSVSDFWRFAMPDLRMNNARGYFAEYLVSRALGLDVVRVEWDDFDVLWDGVKIEVKSSAYLQSWAQRRLSTISFGNLRGRRLDPEAGYVGEQTYNADVYVFAWNTQTVPHAYDPLDVGAWAFHVVGRAKLEALGYKSIGLTALEKLSTRVSFEGLEGAISHAAGRS